MAGLSLRSGILGVNPITAHPSPENLASEWSRASAIRCTRPPPRNQQVKSVHTGQMPPNARPTEFDPGTPIVSTNWVCLSCSRASGDSVKNWICLVPASINKILEVWKTGESQKECRNYWEPWIIGECGSAGAFDKEFASKTSPWGFCPRKLLNTSWLQQGSLILKFALDEKFKRRDTWHLRMFKFF